MNEYKEKTMSFLSDCGECTDVNNENDCKTQKTNPHDLVMGTLTKREYFACAALQGCLINQYTSNDIEHAVKLADALIEELNK